MSARATEWTGVQGNGEGAERREGYLGNRGGAPGPQSNPQRIPDSGSSLLIRIQSAARTLRRIIGAPDYDAYLAHRQRSHPNCPALTEQEFIQQRLDDRYSRPGSRCC